MGLRDLIHSTLNLNLNTDVSKLQLYVWVMVNMGNVE